MPARAALREGARAPGGAASTHDLCQQTPLAAACRAAPRDTCARQRAARRARCWRRRTRYRGGCATVVIVRRSRTPSAARPQPAAETRPAGLIRVAAAAATDPDADTTEDGSVALGGGVLFLWWLRRCGLDHSSEASATAEPFELDASGGAAGGRPHPARRARPAERRQPRCARPTRDSRPSGLCARRLPPFPPAAMLASHRIGLIAGPSGAAKTSARRALWLRRAGPSADDGRPVAERFADGAQATRLLAAVALPAAAFTRPIGGALVRRAGAGGAGAGAGGGGVRRRGRALGDEFARGTRRRHAASVRRSARPCAAARRRPSSLAGCRALVGAGGLTPDWVFEAAPATLLTFGRCRRRRLRQRRHRRMPLEGGTARLAAPAVRLELTACARSRWRRFRAYHCDDDAEALGRLDRLCALDAVLPPAWAAPDGIGRAALGRRGGVRRRRGIVAAGRLRCDDSALREAARRARRAGAARAPAPSSLPESARRRHRLAAERRGRRIAPAIRRRLLWTDCPPDVWRVRDRSSRVAGDRVQPPAPRAPHRGVAGAHRGRRRRIRRPAARVLAPLRWSADEAAEAELRRRCIFE